MVRFIKLGDQINEGVNEFAFFDTVTDKFITFSDCQTWDCISDFISDYKGDELERYLGFIPKDEFPLD